MKLKSPESPPRRAGFSMVELMVVILIIVALATITTGFVRRGISSANAATAMSNLRQCGTILVTKALETNNRLSLFSGGASGGFNERAYNIVREYLGNPENTWNNQWQNRVNIMHWNPKRLPPSNFHWDCYAVNFTDVLKYGVQWQANNGRADGSNARVLFIPSVQRPESYPLLLDSSTASGKEIFRIGISGSELPGLRNQGKANAFFLDGSARSLDKNDLRQAGFSAAYDTSTSPPKLINL